MKDQAKVVIIGGGITGCSIAWHLAKRGWTDVLLLEKGELTSGTTFHSVGLVSQFRTSPALMRLMNYSIGLYDQFRDEGANNIGWHKVGSLRLASSPNRLKALQRQVSRARGLGLDVGTITTSEALDIAPFLSPGGIEGAVHIPDDGWLDPNGITVEFAKRARELGVAIETNCRVTGIGRDAAGAVTHVETDRGIVQTGVIINAAGQWAPRLSAMVGAITPMVPLMHQYLTTRHIPGHELPEQTPVVRDPDNLFYLREEVGGFLVGGFELEPKAWATDGVAWDFTQQLLPEDWELFEPVMEGALRRIPQLEQAEVIKLVNGPDAMTPDGHYCLGPVPGVPGFFVAAGMSLNGIAGAGGVGKVMAEWIIDGEPSLDLHEMNIRRFGANYGNTDFVAEKAREVYHYYYHQHYPADETLWARNHRRSPLYDRLAGLGAEFGEKNGWERVNFFRPGEPSRQAADDQHQWGWGRAPYHDLIREECLAARERVALFDMTSFGKFE
ncbi:MAG: FAD-dependent oxidoreductase, partial [Verrucomicrobiota bacterium]|nr:FAD-dependent oxidoreductase [Verrucomicrobiota bacterium]